jgi:bis(5'-nucleosyl)-tetraphosphatase (symmetrical)
VKINSELFFKYTNYPNQSSYEIYPWYKLVKESLFYPLIFGHWSQLGLNFFKNFVCLDSGCVWGNKLTALRIDDYKIFQVKKSHKD